MTRTLLFALLLTFTVGCTKLEALDVLIPRYGYSQKLDVAYGEGKRQTLDVYIPTTMLEGPRPIVVFFYGGAWQRGEKEDYRFVGESFASKGYVTVVANYRLYPEVSFPGFVQDAALAVKYVRAHAYEFGGDRENLYVTGHSAGAYNALMLAVDPRYLAAVGGDETWIRGAIGLSGPYNFLPLKEPKDLAEERKERLKNIDTIFNTAALEETQPLLCVKDDSTNIPPVFLAHGAEDDLVVPENTVLLAKRLKERGVDVESHIYAGMNHAGPAKMLATTFRDNAPVFADIDGFMKRTQTK